MNVMGERAEVKNEVKGKNNHAKKSSEFHCIINVLAKRLYSFILQRQVERENQRRKKQASKEKKREESQKANKERRKELPMTPFSGSRTSPFPVNSKMLVSSATSNTACSHFNSSVV
jgi:hypothetical protein